MVATGGYFLTCRPVGLWGPARRPGTVPYTGGAGSDYTTTGRHHRRWYSPCA